VALLKMLAVLVAAVGMAMVESVRPAPVTDDDDVGLFVGSAHPLRAELPVSRRRR
jgi:hypothetical protein